MAVEQISNMDIWVAYHDIRRFKSSYLSNRYNALSLYVRVWLKF